MDINQSDLEKWNELEDQWVTTNKLACSAQLAIDYKMRVHLVDSNAPVPTPADQEKVISLWHREAELRALMDKFIAQHYRH